MREDEDGKFYFLDKERNLYFEVKVDSKGNDVL